MSSRTLPSLFPTFLIPSIPFRRRQSSQGSTSSNASSASTASTGSSPTQGQYLSGSTAHLRCARCATDLCLTTQIISKGFTGRYGRAYLVSPTVPYSYSYTATVPPSTSAGVRDGGSLPNTHTHKPVPRQLVTGAHVVSDISCAFCGSVLGWKYVGAEEESQRYKVGKFILETKRVRENVCWENDTEEPETIQGGGEASCHSSMANDMGPMHDIDDLDDNNLTTPPDRLTAEAEVEFDSQDEDECEDLFAGVWSPALANRRRRSKMFGR